MTHLGLVSGTAAAAKGFPTILFDPDAALVDRLRRAELSVSEPGLDAAFAGNRQHLTITARAADLGRADVVYLAPDVPTDDAGTSDLSAVERPLATVRPALCQDAVLVFLSQVPPGFTRGIAGETGSASGRERVC